MNEPVLKIECVMCGYCCSRCPCPYGEVVLLGSGCRFLSEPNEFGQRFCGKYDEIAADPGSWSSPAFGAGCCSSLCNEVRDEVLYKQATKDTIALLTDGKGD